MKLYIYDHCPFCVRARMIFGLKNIDVEQIFLMEDDKATPTEMIGRKMLPILQKEDGSYLPESLDIVHYVDQLAEPKIIQSEVSPEINRWYQAVSETVYKLVVPRFTQAEFPELSTKEARAAYVEREEKAFGDLNMLLKETHTLIVELEPHMDALDIWLEKRTNSYNIDDIMIFPLLRSLSIVNDIPFSTVILNYMKDIAKITGVSLLFDQAK
ncbi:glutaredoxin 2 [Providencia stuartii]|uniref:glutaredoxin 2 n=1 Tax=Providencia TaxID=586 RepID=UPI0027F78F92|nr:glutaredoxin 2 [Providencia sp. 2023EL-00965]ELR5298734.1 glutaredoxin 2 [Providencia stuartii]MDW7587187.1 glutaredoxin 2 [Providencia sp. 2023EL-00965]